MGVTTPTRPLLAEALQPRYKTNYGTHRTLLSLFQIPGTKGPRSHNEQPRSRTKQPKDPQGRTGPNIRPPAPSAPLVLSHCNLTSFYFVLLCLYSYCIVFKLFSNINYKIVT
jgi:hypothetical protein